MYRNRNTAAATNRTIWYVAMHALLQKGTQDLLTHNLTEEYPDELNHGWTQRHDKKCGKQQEHKREHELDANLGGLLLGALAPLGARHFGVGTECLSHARSKAVGLHEHGHERSNVFHAGTR